MTWNELLTSGRVKRHTTGAQEIGALRRVVERDLRDARLEGLSADRRFATAYNAVLQLAKMAIASSGYRVVGLGHHYTTFGALEVAIGPSISELIAYFDMCRLKRHHVDYDYADVISDAEADELLTHAEDLRRRVESWIQKHHRPLSK
jgi:uncharacterized protein (UPF0332 family)